jgi:serine/threonine-protein kinase
MSDQNQRDDDLVDEELTRVWETFIQDNASVSESTSSRDSSARFADWSTASKNNLPTLQSNDGDFSELNVIEQIGVGGMGEVYLAEQESIGRYVAIKTLRSDKQNNSNSNKLLHEARITGRLEHPHIVPVHSLGVDKSGFPLYVMKRVEGVSWKQAIKLPALLPKQFRVENDPLSAHLEIFERVCSAVHFAHTRGILHLDIKPSNVMLGSHGEVLLVDWGIAVSMRDEDRGDVPLVMDLTSPCGTPGYMAPEMAALQHDEIGPATDIYQLAASLHYALVRTSRNQGSDLYDLLRRCVQGGPYSYPETVHPDLASILNRATARSPDARQESADALRAEIARFRTQREARELLALARASLRDFRAFLDGSHEDEGAIVAIYKLYGELRFAIRRALAINPEDRSGEEMFVQTLALMFGFEIERENLSAARAIHRELKDFSARGVSVRLGKLTELEAAIEQRTRQLEEYEEMKQDLDINLSRGKRALVIAALALTWGVIAGASRLLWTFELIEYNLTNIIAVKTFNTLIGLSFVAIAPKLMQLNRVNKQMLGILSLALISGLFVRSVFLWNDLPVHLSLATETLAYLVCILTMAIFVAPVLGLGALFFVVSIIGVLALPERAWEVMIACNMTGLLTIGIIWGKTQSSSSSTATAKDGTAA